MWAATRVRRKCPQGMPQYGKQHIWFSQKCCEPPSELAENALRVYLSMGRKMYRCPCKNIALRTSMGVSRHASSQKYLIEGRNICRFPHGNYAFRVSMGVSRHASSQMPLRYTSAQGSKCMKFLKINMLFGCLWVWAATRVRRKCH